MKFGYAHLTGQKPPNSNRDHQAIYQELIDLAGLAEENDFDSVWTHEHHLWDDGFNPAPLTLSTAIAEATDTIDIGTAILLAPLYDPIRLAEQVAVVDIISQGRFRLGIANGYMDHEFALFDIPKSQRARRVEEIIDICRLAWREEQFSYDGEHFNFKDISVTPTPAQGTDLPILLGGFAKPALRRAANKADGWLGVVKYGETNDLFNESSNESGRSRPTFEFYKQNAEYVSSRVSDNPEFEYYLQLYGHVGATDEEAFETFFPAFVSTRRKYAENSPTSEEWDLKPSNWEFDAIPEERVEAYRNGSLVGSPSSVIEQLRQFDEAVPGEVHVIMMMWYPTLSYEEHAESIKRLGSEVIPEFK